MSRARRGRSEGSIYFRDSDQRWVGTLSLGFDGQGKRKRRTVYGDTKKEVAGKLRELQSAADVGQLPTASKLTLGQFLTHWLAVKKASVATHTHLAYDRDVRLYLAPHLGGVRLSQLTAIHIEQLYAKLATVGVSNNMIRKAGTTLRTALQAAVGKDMLLHHNPAVGVPKPKEVKMEIRPLGPGQLAAFLQAARDDRLFALYIAWIDTGAREGELFALTWADVDFTLGRITITKSLEETKGKLLVKEVKTKASRRSVVLTQAGLTALTGHRKAMTAEGNCAKDKPVFCDTAGGYLRKSNVLRRSFQPILTRAGLPDMRPYDLRHTCATLLLAAGESPKVVSERLGHANIRLTLETYSHVLPGMQQQAATKLNAFLAPSPAPLQIANGG